MMIEKGIEYVVEVYFTGINDEKDITSVEGIHKKLKGLAEIYNSHHQDYYDIYETTPGSDEAISDFYFEDLTKAKEFHNLIVNREYHGFKKSIKDFIKSVELTNPKEEDIKREKKIKILQEEHTDELRRRGL